MAIYINKTICQEKIGNFIGRIKKAGFKDSRVQGFKGRQKNRGGGTPPLTWD
jgi:hypothetical protein